MAGRSSRKRPLSPPPPPLPASGQPPPPHHEHQARPAILEAYLQAACSALNFDIGEIWCCDDVESPSNLHFVQLYTSPAYGVYRSKLVTPSEDDDHHDVSKHRFSPQICEAVRDGGQIVWANTGTEEGLLGRSDLPLRTAVGAPVCCVGCDLCILVLFSPCVLSSTPDAMEFLYTLAQAASEVMCGFLPASASEPVLPASADAQALVSDHRKSQAIIDALKQKSIRLQAWAMGQIPLLAQRLRQATLSPLALPMEPRLGGLGGGGGGGLSAPQRLASSGGSFGNLNLLTSISLGGSIGSPAGGAMSPTADLLDSLFGLSQSQQSPSQPPMSPVTSALSLLEHIQVQRSTSGASTGSGGGGQLQPLALTNGDEVGDGAETASTAGIDDDDFLIWSSVMDAIGPLPADEQQQPAAATSTATGGGGAGSDVGEMGDVDVVSAASAAAAPSPLPSALVVSAGAPAAGLSALALPVAAAAPAPVAFTAAGGGGGGAGPAHCFFEDPFRRSRFEEFVRGLLGMSVFHAADCWLPSTDDRLFLACSSVQNPELSKWTSFSSAVVFAPGVGPPGRIFQQRVAMWFPEYRLVDSAANPLAPVANILGIRTSFGVPIPVGNGKTGVVMFYSTSQLPTSRLMLTFVERAFLVLLGDVPLALPPAAVASSRSSSGGSGHGGFSSAYMLPASAAAAATAGGAAPAAMAVNDASASGGGVVSSAMTPMHPHIRVSVSGGGGGGGGSTSAFGVEAEEGAAIMPGAASSLGRVAGAYDRHQQWMQIYQQQQGMGGGGGGGASASAFSVVQPRAPTTDRKARLPSRPSVASFLVTSSPGGLVKADELAGLPVQGFGTSFVAGSGVGGGGGGGASPSAVRDAASGMAGMRGVPGGAVMPMAAGLSSDMATLLANGTGTAAAATVPRMAGLAAAAAALATSPPPPPAKRPRQGGGASNHHGPSGMKQCAREGCTKTAQGATAYCIGHGGGRRCTFPGCTKGARDRFFCAAHGGGKRCSVEGCKKAAVGGSAQCTAHGGGKRCSAPGCTKSAQASTPFCVKHGGGRLCSVEGCGKVARGRTQFCASHGGGARCRRDNCNRAAVGRTQLCRVHAPQEEGGGADGRPAAI